MDRNKFFSNQEMIFLKKTAKEIAEKCHRQAMAEIDGKEQPVSVYLPGGDNKYPSFWVRDAVMLCSSGLVPISEMITMLDIILSYQNGENPHYLEHGLKILPWAFADHINLKGLGKAELGAVFFPGTYSPTHDQGTGFYGTINAADSPYEVIQLAYLICNNMPDKEIADFLHTPVNSIARIERLDLSFGSVQTDKHTGLHHNREDSWAAESFHDGLKKMGYTLLGSCLRFRAARQMVQLYAWLQRENKCAYYRSVAQRLAKSISQIFSLEDGWLMAATEVDRQADVWGTTLAVYEGILDKETENRAVSALLKAYNSREVVFRGYLRHIPVAYDVIPGKQVWEDGRGGDSGGKYGFYQAGGYWPQPTGWYVWTLSKIDICAAKDLAHEFIKHTKEFLVQGAPFEWIHPDIPVAETPGIGRWYGPSISLPLAAFLRIQGTEIGDAISIPLYWKE